MTTPIRFDNGATYERYMGSWSQLVGEEFLAWLAPASGLEWLDVGCGSGAFTELVVQRCAPSAVHGIDPSVEHLKFAQSRPTLKDEKLREGDAMALPYADATVDAAVMPLVIFFVPDPPRGVAEMARVVRAGGLVCAYAWDIEGRGFPYALVQSELRAMGLPVPAPPNPSASRADAMAALWQNAGLVDVETRAIEVTRAFANFDEYWETVRGGPSLATSMNQMDPATMQELQTRLRALLPADETGRIAYSARANAVRGRVPNTGPAQ